MSYHALGQEQPSIQAPSQEQMQSWWQQAQSWAQQYQPGAPLPSGPAPAPGSAPAPAPTPLPPGSTSVVAEDNTTTYLVAGGIALVGLVALVFVLKK